MLAEVIESIGRDRLSAEITRMAVALLDSSTTADSGGAANRAAPGVRRGPLGGRAAGAGR